MTKKTKSKKASKKKSTKHVVEFDENMPDICIDGEEHAPDTYSFSQADGAPWFFDVRCSKCKRSGSAHIEPSSIQW
jgi:hypothetical protein